MGESVRTILEQDYPGPLEVVVVDDRSTDRTYEILESLKPEHASLLSVLRVAELPDMNKVRTMPSPSVPRKHVATGCSLPTRTCASRRNASARLWGTLPGTG